MLIAEYDTLSNNEYTQEVEINHHTLDVDVITVYNLADYLNAINQGERLQEVLENGCRDIKQAEEFIKNFPL